MQPTSLEPVGDQRNTLIFIRLFIGKSGTENKPKTVESFNLQLRFGGVPLFLKYHIIPIWWDNKILKVFPLKSEITEKLNQGATASNMKALSQASVNAFKETMALKNL